MTISATSVQNSSILKALQLNRSVKANHVSRQSSFGRDLVTFSPVSIAVNRAFNHAGLDYPSQPLTSVDLLRGRAGSNLKTFNQFLNSATFSSTYSALGDTAATEVNTLVASILTDSQQTSSTFYDRLGRINTILYDSETAATSQ